MLNAMKQARDALDEFDARLTQWAAAYPTSVFPEVEDWKAVDATLAAAGLSLTRVSAANMRHVVTTLNKDFERVRAALASLDAAIGQQEAQTDPETLRPAFEAWAQSEFSIGFADEDSILLNRSGDGYDDAEVDGAWRGLLYASRMVVVAATHGQQEAQEPVAWISHGELERVKDDRWALAEVTAYEQAKAVPLYTSPVAAAPQGEQQALSDERASFEAQEPVAVSASLAGLADYLRLMAHSQSAPETLHRWADEVDRIALGDPNAAAPARSAHAPAGGVDAIHGSHSKGGA